MRAAALRYRVMAYITGVLIFCAMSLYLGLYGLLLIGVILFEPLGLVGLWLRIWRRRK